MIVINSVQLSKTAVSPGEKITISVEICTWDHLKATMTWNKLKTSGLTWQQLKDRCEI